MLKKTDLKMVGLVALGVIAAGYIFKMAGTDTPIISDARNGYDY